MVTVGKYTIHGSYGLETKFTFLNIYLLLIAFFSTETLGMSPGKFCGRYQWKVKVRKEFLSLSIHVYIYATVDGSEIRLTS